MLYYFYRWQKNQVLDKLMDALNAHSRTAEDAAGHPPLSLDGQSVKLSPIMGKSRGIDGYKKINGTQAPYCCEYAEAVLGCICEAC
jgi:hypothetical protein